MGFSFPRGRAARGYRHGAADRSAGIVWDSLFPAGVPPGAINMMPPARRHFPIAPRPDVERFIFIPYLTFLTPLWEKLDILTAQIDNKKISFYVRDVERVLNAVAVTELPEHPDILLGVISFHGVILPVADIRRKFALPPKPVEPEDKIIVLKSQDRRFAVYVDHILNSLDVPGEKIKNLNSSWPELNYKDNVLDTSGDLIIINNTGAFFLNADIYQLNEILKKISGETI
ncbi:MAG: chemotaxis protein CheW [archaeon]